MACLNLDMHFTFATGMPRIANKFVNNHAN